MKSPTQRVHAHFAGQHHLMPRADERVTKCEELEDAVLVVYANRERRRILTIENLAGVWTVTSALERPIRNPVTFARERGMSGDPQFHFTKEPMTATAAKK